MAGMAGAGRDRGPLFNQSVVGGGVLLAVALFALWATSSLAWGTLANMGPALLPRSLAVMLAICGAALIFFGVVGSRERVTGFSARAAILVPLAIFLFAITIRPVTIGPITTPGLGLVVAGPLAILVGGAATPDGRLGDNLILSLLLTPFCMVLFGDLLNLPIPIFPQSIAGYFPADWTQRGILRAIAAAMTILGLLGAALAWGRRHG